jgi:hypothetical protein
VNVSSEPLTIRSIVCRYFSRWAHGRKLRADVMRAASSIIQCRTASLGAHVERCDCGHITHIKYNSCRHRSCPECRGGRRADWLQKTVSQLLPCDHVHIIFTVPEELNLLWQFNRAGFADRLMKAARESLETLLADPKYLGARPGIISALHTWGRNLSIHPHVHCLVTAGGIDADGRFIRSTRSVFLPGGVLRAVFRGKLCESLKDAIGSGDLEIPPSMTAVKCRSLLNRLGRVNWNVRLQERYPHGVSVAGYLARYMSGGPISDRRLCSVSDDAIVFRYRDHRDGAEKQMRISPHDFLSRWFEHVPPRGLRMIRRSGVYANCSGDVRKSICEQLTQETASAHAAEQSGVAPLDAEVCPLCNTCVTVRFVCRFVAGAVFEGVRLDAPLTPYTRPP